MLGWMDGWMGGWVHHTATSSQIIKIWHSVSLFKYIPILENDLQLSLLIQCEH